MSKLIYLPFHLLHKTYVHLIKMVLVGLILHLCFLFCLGSRIYRLSRIHSCSLLTILQGILDHLVYITLVFFVCMLFSLLYPTLLGTLQIRVQILWGGVLDCFHSIALLDNILGFLLLSL